jgi:hypothetical protein
MLHIYLWLSSNTISDGRVAMTLVCFPTVPLDVPYGHTGDRMTSVQTADLRNHIPFITRQPVTVRCLQIFIQHAPQRTTHAGSAVDEERYDACTCMNRGIVNRTV